MSGCAIPGCTDQMRSGRLMCRWHWRKVPKAMQQAVLSKWAVINTPLSPAFTSERSMEDRLCAIREYQDARQAAIADVCRQEGLHVVAK